MLLKGVKDEIEVRITAVCEMDNGGEERVTFHARYRKHSVADAGAILQAVSDGEETDETLMAKNLLGWRGLKGADGQEVPFTPEHVDIAMQAREYRTALVNGFMEVLLGRETMSRKNSLRPGTRSA
jgi:hypothetical protein